MSRFTVRTLCSENFGAARQPEADVFRDDVLCPHHLRLRTELSGNACLLAPGAGHPAGCSLYVVRGRDACCTTLAVRMEFQRTRVTPMRPAGFVQTAVAVAA